MLKYHHLVSTHNNHPQYDKVLQESIVKYDLYLIYKVIEVKFEVKLANLRSNWLIFNKIVNIQ